MRHERPGAPARASYWVWPPARSPLLAGSPAGFVPSPVLVIIRKSVRGRGMFFISSGAVEVVLPNKRVRLGGGEFFGEMALLSRRQADVVSLGYDRVLELPAADFRRFLSKLSAG
jgi:CRP-like cAMP-binding protein